jgi:hypothetical protein
MAMSLRSFLAGLFGRWEGSLDRAFRNTVVERHRSETARGEFISALIIDGAAPVRERDGGVSHRTLGD